MEKCENPRINTAIMQLAQINQQAGVCSRNIEREVRDVHETMAADYPKQNYLAFQMGIHVRKLEDEAYVLLKHEAVVANVIGDILREVRELENKLTMALSALEAAKCEISTLRGQKENEAA